MKLQPLDPSLTPATVPLPAGITVSDNTALYPTPRPHIYTDDGDQVGDITVVSEATRLIVRQRTFYSVLFGGVIAVSMVVMALPGGQFGSIGIAVAASPLIAISLILTICNGVNIRRPRRWYRTFKKMFYYWPARAAKPLFIFDTIIGSMTQISKLFDVLPGDTPTFNSFILREEADIILL